MRRDHGLGDAAEVLLSGGSAGGLATYLHADYVRATFADDVKFRAAPISGFFAMRPTAAGAPEFEAVGRHVYELQNASVNAACVAALGSEAWRCFFANYSYFYAKTSIFPLQSAVDSYQMSSIYQADPACAGSRAGNQNCRGAFKVQCLCAQRRSRACS